MCKTLHMYMLDFPLNQSFEANPTAMFILQGRKLRQKLKDA